MLTASSCGKINSHLGHFLILLGRCSTFSLDIKILSGFILSPACFLFYMLSKPRLFGIYFTANWTCKLFAVHIANKNNSLSWIIFITLVIYKSTAADAKLSIRSLCCIMRSLLFKIVLRILGIRLLKKPLPL